MTAFLKITCLYCTFDFQGNQNNALDITIIIHIYICKQTHNSDAEVKFDITKS